MYALTKKVFGLKKKIEDIKKGETTSDVLEECKHKRKYNLQKPYIK